LRVIAFGNRLVCKHLDLWLEPLIKIRAQFPLQIEIVTQADREILRWFDYWRARERFGDSLSFTMWNEFQMPHAFARNRICLIPSQDDPYNYTKSTNRLVEASLAGLFTICWPLPSYQPFQDYFCVTRDVNRGLEALLALDSPQDNIRNGQDHALANFSQQRIGGAWEKIVNDNRGSTVDLSGNPELEMFEIEGLPVWRINKPERIRFTKLLFSLDQLLRKSKVNFCHNHVVLSIGGNHPFFDLQSRSSDHVSHLKREIERLHPKGFWQITSPNDIREDSRVLPHQIPEQVNHWMTARTLLTEHRIFTKYQLDEIEELKWVITIPFQGLLPIDELSQAIEATLEAIDIISEGAARIKFFTLDNIAFALFGYQILKYVQQKAQHSPVAWIP